MRRPRQQASDGCDGSGDGNKGSLGDANWAAGRQRRAKRAAVVGTTRGRSGVGCCRSRKGGKGSEKVGNGGEAARSQERALSTHLQIERGPAMTEARPRRGLSGVPSGAPESGGGGEGGTPGSNFGEQRGETPRRAASLPPARQSPRDVSARLEREENATASLSLSVAKRDETRARERPAKKGGAACGAPRCGQRPIGGKAAANRPQTSDRRDGCGAGRGGALRGSIRGGGRTRGTDERARQGGREGEGERGVERTRRQIRARASVRVPVELLRDREVFAPRSFAP